MPDDFQYDVFLSHSSKDKTIVRDIAERLKNDGIKVWFDEWEIKPGDCIPAKIEEGLERSRVLVLCMSANAFGSDWAQLESGTFRFRDPLNKERRFLPLRLDDAPIKGSLAQFLYIDWRWGRPIEQFEKLFEACRLSKIPSHGFAPVVKRKLRCGTKTISYAFDFDGKNVLSGGGDHAARLWDLDSENLMEWLEAGEHNITSVALVHEMGLALCGDNNGDIHVWDLGSKSYKRTMRGHVDIVWELEVSADGGMALSCSWDESVRLWSLETGKCVQMLNGHNANVQCIKLSVDAQRCISGGYDKTLRVWDLTTGDCLKTINDAGFVSALAWSDDERKALSASDNTLRLWNLETGRCLRVLEGHTAAIRSISWIPGQRCAVTGSNDATIRLWNLETGLCLGVLEGHSADVVSVTWCASRRCVFSGDSWGGIYAWDVLKIISTSHWNRRRKRVDELLRDQIQYANAKVLLVGESGVGKTGLSKRLALNDWQPSDSTVGAWATQWKLPVLGDKDIEREIWLWDFGGQADQRLIHQLYMDETALAVLVFDGQKEDLFETLGQWDRDLTRASRKEFAKLLVAGRVDAGGLRLSRGEVEKFAAERKFGGFLETSAKTGLRCEELKQAILDAIPWDELPCRTTEVLFKRLKEEIIALKDEGRVLMRFNELRETLQLRLSGELARFADEELRAVLTLLAGPGVVWELAFGSWVLLQPERINAYAQAVIRTLQADEHQRGCLMEERVLKGDLMYESSMTRLEGDEERFVLLAMHQTLVERGLCLRQPTTQGNLLVFPSYYRKERPDLVQHPAVQVNYRFTGFLDELYATLVVRLHHSDAFEQDELWRYAADFKTNAGKQLGIKLTRRAPGMGDLEVYFDAAVSVAEKIIFSKYVHEHLLQHARDVERLRHYVCPECGTAVGNREVAMKRLNDWLRGQPPETPGGFRLRSDAANPPTIICVGCEQRVPLWDEMEQCFASPEIQQRVRDMQEEAKVELDNESKERALVGEVISTVALAAQISREKNVSDHGIDMEIEFKDDAHVATHRFIFLQLKSSDSYTRKRKKDGTEIFTIKDERHARYWMASPFPVLLVIRNSEGEVRWMEIRDYLKRVSENGTK